jgi:16S rRNA (guanine966-N2)-methyltransferase
VLADRVVGVGFLDAFAGTGAVGLEALSRGAAHATFVEQDRKTVRLLDANIAACGAAASSTVVHAPFADFARRHAGAGPFELVFVDPPYDVAAPDEILRDAARLVGDGGLVVFEHSRRRSLPDAVPGLTRTRALTAGDSTLSFYATAPRG